MPCQRVQQRLLHRLAVADFADHDEIGRLAQRVRERPRVVESVDVQLALVDHALLVPEQIFDRVFDRQDVTGAVRVAVIDHRRQRRRLAGAGGTGDHDEPALLHDEVEQHRRQPQLLEGGDVAAHVADDERDRPALAEDVDPEVADVRIEVREIHLVLGLEGLRLLVGHELVGDAAHRVEVHRPIRQRRDDAVDLHVDRRAARNEQVGRLAVRHHLEQSIEVHAGRPPGLQSPVTRPSAVPRGLDDNVMIRRGVPASYPVGRISGRAGNFYATRMSRRSRLHLTTDV